MKLLFLFICLFLSFLVIVSILIKKQKKHSNHHMPGKLHLVDGYHIHYIEKGTQFTSPVIFCHGCGIGNGALVWELVAEEVSTFAHTISYDRGGNGWSDAGHQPRTIDESVHELYQFLLSLNVVGPYVLVGHSYGAIVIRQFAQKYPHLVNGMVLVDAAHEKEKNTAVMSIAHVLGQHYLLLSYLLLYLFSMVGLLPLILYTPFAKNKIKLFPNSLQPSFHALFLCKNSAKTAFQELSQYHKTSIRTFLGHFPLIVLKSNLAEKTKRDKYEMYKMAEKMATSTTHGKVVVTENSGHHIHLDEPQIVVKAIKEVWHALDCK